MKFPEPFRFSFAGTKYQSKPGDDFGLFLIPGAKAPGRRTLRVIASSGDGEIPWEHVSVSINGAAKQTPTWPEMCFVKGLFWDSEAWVVQFHPAESCYVNHHPGVLHLWRCTNKEFPQPPIIAV